MGGWGWYCAPEDRMLLTVPNEGVWLSNIFETLVVVFLEDVVHGLGTTHDLLER